MCDDCSHNFFEDYNHIDPYNCSHNFIEDYIDIDPDKSVQIFYCTLCLITYDYKTFDYKDINKDNIVTDISNNYILFQK